MKSIRKIHEEIQEKKKQKRHEDEYIPSEEIPDLGEVQINTSVVRSMCDPYNLIYLDSSKLIEPNENVYFYNAGFYENDEKTYRMFYRCGKNPKGYEDRIATCLLDKQLNILSETNKYLNVHSCWHETTQGKYKFKIMIPFLFKNGLHVEDPRAIRRGLNWFVLYTDGICMGIAKLDEDCNVIYSHYLHVPENVTTSDSDGREKNWIPIKFEGEFLHIMYSECPRIIFKYVDSGSSLDLIKTVSLPYYQIGWTHGYIRGGCPPVPYENDKYIWFFHSVKKIPTYTSEQSRVYMIGGYITETVYPYTPIKVTVLPILVGWPSHVVPKLILQDNVVFPCGAIHKENDTYIICMGVNDYKIAYLEVKVSDLLWIPSAKTMKLGMFETKI